MELSPRPSAPVLPQRNERRGSSHHQIGRTLRRGTVAFGLAIGDFFGVTEASQQGNEDSVGWGQVAQIRAEEAGDQFSTLRRARQFARGGGGGGNIEPALPPDYNELEMSGVGRNAPTGFASGFQSFNIDELSSSDESVEETFFGEPPPSYTETISRPPPPTSIVTAQGGSGAGGRAISMYGHEDPTRASPLPDLLPIPEERTPTSSRSNLIDEEQYIDDPERAIKYYMDYIKAEQRIRQRQNRQNASEFFGEGSERIDAGPPRSRGRTSSVGEAVVLKRSKGRSKLQRQNTLVREKVQSLPTFWPIFIFGITFVQVVVVVVLIILRGLAPINIAPNEHSSQFPSLYNETGNETVVYYGYTNPWVGIGVLDLIQCGAKFTPCMRRDRAIERRNLIYRASLKEVTNPVGCCRNNIWVGTTLQDDCVHSHSPMNNTQFESGTSCEDTNTLLANFHPCCIGIIGQCKVTHIRECNERGGVFHSALDSCNETNCLNNVCGFNGVGTVNNDPLVPSGSQTWRLVLSLFVHLGVIDVVIIGVLQLYLGIKIERTAGFLRIALIYFIAGIGGNLVSAIFIPYQVTGGASAAVFGLISVLFVELFQSWQIVDRAWLELIKLIVVMVFLLAVGTLPFIDNLANLGGILFGVPAAIIFLPYITFGKVDAWRKRILLIICIPVLILLFLVCFLVFYFITDPDFCSFCHYFNCVPYSSTLCNNEINSPNPEVVAL